MKVFLEVDLKDADESLIKTELCGKALVQHAALLLKQHSLPYGSPEIVLDRGEQDTPWAYIRWSLR